MYHRTEVTITMATKQITPTTKVSDEVEKQETSEVERKTVCMRFNRKTAYGKLV
jgi:hypothetical protein